LKIDRKKNSFRNRPVEEGKEPCGRGGGGKGKNPQRERGFPGRKEKRKGV